MSLSSCFQSLNKGKPLFGDAEMKEIRAAANKLILSGTKPAEAEKMAVNSMLGEAIAEQKSISDAIREAAGIPAKPADKMDEAAKPPQEPKAEPSAKEKADADFEDALGDLGDIIGKNFRATMTPEQEQKLMPVLTRLFDAAFRKGYYKFREAARFVLDAIGSRFGNDVADEITLEHLQGSYIGMAGRYKDQGADSARDVVAVESKDELGESNVTDQRSGTDLERDSQDAETADGVGAQGVQAGRAGNGGTGGSGVQGNAGAERGQQRSGGISGYEATADGNRGNLEIYTGDTGSISEASVAGDSLNQRSDSSGIEGSPIESDATSVTEELAASGFSLIQAKSVQHRADKKEHKPGLTNIRETLPILTEGQQEDVHKAETRFSQPDGYGMLFTNGTGTGKTFTGLGIIKRFDSIGKSNTIVVVPNDKIADDWQKAGKLLGLNISRLTNTKSAGSGIVITTYANFGQNDELAKREWDLIVHDEAHYLKMDSKGSDTLALDALKAISLHPDGVYTRASMLHRDLIDAMNEASAEAKTLSNSDDQRNWVMAEVHQKKADKLAKQFREASDKLKEYVNSKQGAARPRALFLSATPFAYEKSVDWANGYLFDYDEGQSGQDHASGSGAGHGYNSGNWREQFFMQHFGYRMRYNKLTEPDAKVDRGLMQRQFNSWLKKRGVLSGRMLDVKADYDRRFILVESAIGQRIDEALQWFEKKRKEGDERKGLSAVRDVIGKKFDYLSRRYLLEAIKAQEVIPHVREHLAMGRKVVVFHDYKKGGGFNPFDITGTSIATSAEATQEDKERGAEFNAIVSEFRHEFRDLIASDVWKASSPIVAFQNEFPRALLFNGDIPAKERRANVERFQDDASGPQVFLVQSAAGKEGISLHDTTGKHQRVLFNLGQPTQPTTAIQQEGRVYRTGQVTDAIFRYLNTGTNWEKWAFATTIAQRASAAENLGMGEQARALKDAFIAGFEESDDYRAGMEGEGKGGKERDKAANNALTEYDRAKAFYFGTQKKNSRTKAQEGADYFATPEPVGLKMVELADIRAGEHTLEPSAGHGAIARWMPTTSENTAVEPSMTLRPRLAMVFEGKIVDTDFESLHVSNKYDAIVMNPPFGSGGRTAVDHLAKAATHLRDGGRVVALIPTGPAADKKFEKWFYEEESRPAKPMFDHPEFGKIYDGDTLTMYAFGNDLIIGNAVIDKIGEAYYARPKGEAKSSGVNLAALKGVKATGKRTETFNPAEGFQLVADIKLPQVTFERAGTAVATRIVVIEKSANAPHQVNRDYSNVEDINELFDRMENLTIPARAKQVEEVAEPAETARRTKKPEVDHAAAQEVAQAAGLEIIEHTTGKGKVLRGVVRKDLTHEEAKKIDEYTFKKDGGFFIREKHLVKPEGEAPLASQPVQQNSTPQTVESVTKATAKLRASWLGLRRVKIVQSVREIPNDIYLRALRALKPIDQGTEGVYDPESNTVYLIADNIASPDRAVWVSVHEVVGHGGIRMLGAPVVESLNHAAKNGFVAKLAQAIAADRKETFNTKEHTDEVIAELAAATITGNVDSILERYGVKVPMGMRSNLLGMVKRVVDAVRGFIAKVMGKPVEAVSDGEVLGLILRMKDAVEGDAQGYDAADVSDGALASRAPAQQSPKKQSSLPGVSASPPASPTRQPPLGLQGGQSGNRASWDSPEPSMFDDMVYKLQDKNIDLKRVVKAIKDAGQQIAERFNPYLAEELFHGRAAKRVQDFVNTELKPLMVEMQVRGIGLEALDEYLHARHAKEANALIAQRDPNMPDGGSGMTDQQADDYFANLPAEKLKRLEATAKRVDAIIAKTREYYASYGLVSRDTVDGWAQMFQHYVPLMRDDHDGGMGIGQGFSIKGKEVKHRTGSTAAVVDIFANIALQREKAIVRGEKNRVAVALAGLAKLNPNPDFWTFDKIPTERVLNEQTGLVEERADPMFKSRDNVVVAKIRDNKGNIQERAVIFNEHDERAVRMAEAMKNLDATQLGGLLGVSAKITSYFSSINTQYNPIFGVTNLVRDVQGAALNLTSTPLAGKQKEVMGHILSAAKGIYLDARAERKGAPATSKWAGLWEELQDQGGMTGYRDLYRNSEDRAKAIEHELDPHNWVDSKWGQVFTAGGMLKVPLTKAQDVAAPLFDWLSDYNLMMEGATRLSIYKTAIDNGMTKQAAASLAKNTTVNFNRKGQSGQQAGALYAFFNAAMQGTARIGETVFDMDKGDIKTLRLSKVGKAIVGGGVLLGVMQALALAAAGFDDDEPPEFLRERNLIIPIGGKKYILIPMPLGFHAIPNVGRITTEFAMGGFKHPADHVIRLAGVFAEAFNPIGSAGVSMQTIAPTALDPFAALAENKDWTGKPVYKEDFNSMKPTPGFTRNKDTASVWSKFMAEGINYATGGTDYTPGTFSPTADQIDYLIGQVTGGVGREISKAAQTGSALATGEDLPTHKIPLFGRFYGDSENQSSQGNAFYSNLKEINLIEQELKGRREDQLPVEEFIRENPKSKLIGHAKHADSIISKLRRRKRELIENDAPREQIKPIEERITAEMLRFNQAVDKFEGRAP